MAPEWLQSSRQGYCEAGRECGGQRFELDTWHIHNWAKGVLRRGSLYLRDVVAMRLHVARSQDKCSSQRWRRLCLHFHTRHTATEYGTTGTVVTWSLWFTMTTTTSNGIAGFAAQNSNCSSGFLLIAVRFIFYFCFVSCSILLFCFIFGFCSIFAAQFSRAAIRSTLTRSL